MKTPVIPSNITTIRAKAWSEKISKLCDHTNQNVKTNAEMAITGMFQLFIAQNLVPKAKRYALKDIYTHNYLCQYNVSGYHDSHNK